MTRVPLEGCFIVAVLLAHSTVPSALAQAPRMWTADSVRS